MHTLLHGHAWLLLPVLGFTLSGFGSFLKDSLPSVTNLLANAGVFGQQAQNKAVNSPLSPVVNPAVTTSPGVTYAGVQQFGTQGLILVFILFAAVLGFAFIFRRGPGPGVA